MEILYTICSIHNAGISLETNQHTLNPLYKIETIQMLNVWVTHVGVMWFVVIINTMHLAQGLCSFLSVLLPSLINEGPLSRIYCTELK